MSTTRLLLAVSVAAAALVGWSAPAWTADAPLPPARPVPGLTAADKHPEGCVDCHVVDKTRGHDERLSVALAEWTAGKIDAELLAQTRASMPAGVTAKGKHPAAEDSAEDIPAACLDCHDAGSRKAPPFAKLLHLVHLTGGGKSPFMTVFQGECTHCHKLDAKTGEWRLPSGPEN